MIVHLLSTFYALSVSSNKNGVDITKHIDRIATVREINGVPDNILFSCFVHTCSMKWNKFYFTVKNIVKGNKYLICKLCDKIIHIMAVFKILIIHFGLLL